MSPLINGFIIFSLTVTLLYFVGLLTFVNDHEENKCEMTYMFEYPQFVRISNKIDDKYPRYGLYAYSEGRLTEKTRNMFFDGIPVLFIPGNAGSHRQGRSLASVALRKALNSRTPFHFDYFLIDLNNELSGLNGALLADQLEYVNNSIYTVLDLYQNRKNPAKSVVLVGHSMGGIIAKRLVSNLGENSDLVPIVLGLATPHRRPPLQLDSFSYDFYKNIDTKNSSTTFVSITGGYNDFLVPSFLTNHPDSILNVVSTQIPRSWLPADHVCILWCKQSILAINRALVDSVDPKTKQISSDQTLRYRVFHHHLIHHSGINIRLLDSYSLSPNIKNQGEWIEPFGRQYSVQVPRLSSSPHFYMIRLLNQPQHQTLTVVALNLETVDWAFVCGAHIPRGNSRICEEFTHLTHLSEISPSSNYKRRSLTVDMHELMKNNTVWTHIVLRVLPTDEQVILNVDVYNTGDRKTLVNLPNLLSFKRQTIIEQTHEKAIHYELVLPNLYHLMQSYQLYVESIQCVNQFRHATASLIVPWGHQNQHKFFIDGDNKPMNVRLYSSRPQWASNQSAVIQLRLDPTCRYKISIQSSFIGVLSQLARFYSPLLIVNVAAVILVALNTQLKSLGQENDCCLFFTAVKEGAKPYYILTSVKLISRFLSFKPFVTYLAAPDWLIMSEEGTDFFLLPLLLYICSVGIVWLLGIFLSVSLVVCETTVHKFTLKFLAKTVSFTVSWSDYLMSALHKLPCIVATFLICLCVTTTGSLALCVGMVFYFMRLTQLSQDYIEELVWYYVKKIGKKLKKPNKDKDNNSINSGETPAHNAIFFHATLFLLWSILTVINVPSVLTWAHNFKFSTALKPDPAFYPGLVLSICALPLWQLDVPKIERRGYVELGKLIIVLAVASLIYAPISLFRLNFTLTSAIAFVTLHQLVAPNREIPETSRTEQPISYETIKAKLE
ncbi:GPI inositol-deacylase-like Protein [Tribolium castaneum]|uniref:GPI inositol-deacylase n=1 Tax=Tribolium castaneum TaxID=7070 RepID=D6WW73_TRICA|nr:PREDICTED: GPI inositol-deacylase [Tribolium castaneum]EFA08175.1 GPI inositol-deacylase-like Protein [Tribolium castaneum]|eukprot:XP_008196749.1 PREDICTED: GPI inositol-deacylase [Tribolium castaneum]